MGNEIAEFSDVIVKVDDVIYMPSLEAPPERPHPFVYFLSIHNKGFQEITIRGRKWVVRQDDGETTVVEGEGVVGQVPKIRPGEHFSYNSYHTTATHARVAGSFFGTENSGKKSGQRFYVKIPEFRLEVPQWA